jgi:hypothetical protein
LPLWGMCPGVATSRGQDRLVLLAPEEGQVISGL